LSNAARILLMLIAVNSAAWLAGRVRSGHAPAPLDFGFIAWDGQRLLGSHKSWRGFISGAIAGAAVGRLCGLSWWIGCGFGALSLLGDALSSAIKRRLRRPPGADVPLLDQLPEALLPMALLWSRLSLDWPQAAGVVAAFVVLDLLWTRLWSARWHWPAVGRDS
jgi:CDP-diglyceride synthetase